jgi:hypothetical protein
MLGQLLLEDLLLLLHYQMLLLVVWQLMMLLHLLQLLLLRDKLECSTLLLVSLLENKNKILLG